MKKQIAKLLLILVALNVGLTACAPSSRDQNKNQKPTEVAPSEQTLKVGDIIFHKSQSKQSKAIKEASQSEWTHVGILISKDGEWYVSEAIGPVVSTKLQDFINRGKDKEYKIYRFKYFDAISMEDKLLEAIQKQNKAYDIYFEISDESTYCSELVYKAMLEVTGHEVGSVQQFKDLKLSGPQVKALIKRRLTDKGRVLDPEEPIITPASQMLDPNMTLIKESLKK
ncbi:YiiX/YebB-like N1pC/P60 family cysteine hydrolase [Pseudobdellovibrio sp. HCB154]|uniref:YiiX/YebB-like N1pC/P60 family cysteine hydrolase n=1 Tax=Pseudobdellovibrio sp. HCB154 TaxID=3386277 RepID=UPI0039170995